MTRSHGGSPGAVTRGRIYGAVLSEDVGEKYYLAVSNNARNKVLDSFLALRLTTTNKPPLDTVVRLAKSDGPWVGAFLADDITEVFHNEVTRDVGALSPGTMRRVDDALRAALAL
ncbi:type II toxin-antitoxin system PemK/MazF family toxin [Kibdelosporangium lantanae]|uniref:Type II toxin-antitoxin system PemK/MazF family toxin n=1 Tax=Kibdelosporangium lantanae TaxID=1497396 RepID=A0ABW3MAN8_9PSEU